LIAPLVRVKGFMEQKGAIKTQHMEAIMMRDYVKEKVLARGKKVSIGIDVTRRVGRLQPSLKGKSYFMGGCLRTIQRWAEVMRVMRVLDLGISSATLCGTWINSLGGHREH